MNYLLTKLLKWIAGKFDGYKTKIGSAGLILLGLASLLNLLWPGTVPGLPETDLDAIIASISLGFVGLGHGGKMDKQTAAIKESANVLQISAAEPQRIVSPELTADQRNALNAN